MEELNLTMGQSLLFIAIQIILLAYLLTRPAKPFIDLSENSQEDPGEVLEQETTIKPNPNYGAYLQAQGRYFN